MQRKIRSVFVQGMQYKVGEIEKPFAYSVGGAVNGATIAEIKDVSQQFEDHVFCSYLVKDEHGNVLARIENCPAVVEYEA